MNANVAVVGEGLLADFVCGRLYDRYKVDRRNDFTEGVPEAVELVVVLHDEWPASGFLEAEEVMRQAGIPWLRGFVSLDEGVVGPLVRPDTPGCSQCADDRRFTAGRNLGPTLDAGAAENTPRNGSAFRLAVWHAAHLLVAETNRVLQGRRAYTEDHMYIINLNTLKSSLHYFLPDPLCTVCGRLPDDSSAAAGISLQPRLKISPDSYRCRPLDELNEALVKQYVDSETGLFNANMQDIMSPFAGVNVNMPSFMAADEVTAGRSHRYAESELTAILEGLERRCGQTPRGKRTVVHDCFRNVAAQALDPVKVGLYTKEQYAQPDFPFEPYAPDLQFDWIWGYSFLRKRPILVPELLAYYGSSYGGGFVQEGSNGCALGGSLEEAILYGIMEVVERDSFLMTWYARLPAPRLDPNSANDRELRLMIERLRAVAGYDVHLFNTTTENGIPSVWALAKSQNPGNMNLICSAGAHLDPLRAAKSAIHEIAGTMVWHQMNFEASRPELVPMLHDPSLVRQMDHHVLLYGLPQAEERLLFLLDGKSPLRTFDEEFARRASHADLTDDLKEIIDVFRRLNLDVIVVDQTSPEILRNGLYCVKVLIPGMLPMTFGHHLTRVTELERVLKVPAELGYVKELLTIDQLNAHPHPFL